MGVCHTVVQLPKALFQRSEIKMAFLPRVEGRPQRLNPRILGVFGFDVHLLRVVASLSIVYHG